MKLFKVVAMSLMVSIVLAGCSGETEAEAELREANEQLEKELAELDKALEGFEDLGTEEVEASEEEVVEEAEEVEASSGTQVYDIIKESRMGDVVEMGDLKLTFNGSTLGKMIATEDDALFTDFNAGEEMYIVAFDVNIENIGSETAEDFFVASSEIATDTKEQIKIDSMYSDNIPMDIYAGTDHHATLVFFTQSPPEDISEVRFMVPKFWGSDISNPVYDGGEVTVTYQ